MSSPVSFAPLRRRPWVRRVALVSAMLVPLAFTGLVVGALAQADSAAGRIPAAVVNGDTLVNSTAADGTTSPVFAGRLLVTQLTAPDDGAPGAPTGPRTGGFDWIVTNAADASAALERGEVYAVLTVPSNFSASILSLSGANPERAELSIRTDDAHSYLAGSVVQAVGDGLASAFGNEITAQYIGGLYASVGTVGAALGSAATGALGLQGGADQLSVGLSGLAAGASSAHEGAATLSSGLTSYTRGVDSLSTGLTQLDSGAAALGQVSAGVGSYTEGIGRLSSTLSAINGSLQASNADSTTKATLQAVVDGLAQSAVGGPALAGQTSGALSGIQSGISGSAAGAAKLAGGSAKLRSGADSLATGLADLAAGAADSATGAATLSSGAGELASGLQSGADQFPTGGSSDAAANAEIAADPVALTIDRDNAIPRITQVIATFFVPLGLWLGAFATFLVLRPLAARVLTSSASGARLMASTLGRALLVAGVQAIALVALLHTALGVGAAALPATLGFALVMAAAFTAFHYLLTALLGRGGLVVSLLLVALQITATGGLYPVEALAAPFRVLSPLLPLTYGVSGMQSIISGADPGRAIAAVLALAGFGLVSALAASVALRHSRRSAALARLLPASSRE